MVASTYWSYTGQNLVASSVVSFMLCAVICLRLERRSARSIAMSWSLIPACCPPTFACGAYTGVFCEAGGCDVCPNIHPLPMKSKPSKPMTVRTALNLFCIMVSLSALQKNTLFAIRDAVPTDRSDSRNDPPPPANITIYHPQRSEGHAFLATCHLPSAMESVEQSSTAFPAPGCPGILGEPPQCFLLGCQFEGPRAAQDPWCVSSLSSRFPKRDQDVRSQ